MRLLLQTRDENSWAKEAARQRPAVAGSRPGVDSAGCCFAASGDYAARVPWAISAVTVLGAVSRAGVSMPVLAFASALQTAVIMKAAENAPMNAGMMYWLLMATPPNQWPSTGEATQAPSQPMIHFEKNPSTPLRKR